MTSAWRTRAAGLIAALTAIRLAIIATTAIANGEAYYASWARFPSWSYYDHPPLVAWMTWLMTRLSWDGFFVRLGPVLCALVFGALVYRLGERLFSPRAGFFALAAVSVPPAFFVTAMVLNPEAPLAPLWVLALLLLEGMREHDEPWRPIAAGAAMGLAFLAKYTGVLVVPAALFYLAASPKARRWLRRPSLYLGALTSLVVAAPVVIWNQLHHWPSLTLHFVERAAPIDGATVAHNALFVLIGQLGAFQPLMLPLLLAAFAFAIARARQDDRFRFLALMGVPVLLFLYVAMLRVVDAETHWTMVAFVPACVAAGAWLDERLERGPLTARLRWTLRAAVALTALAIAVGYLHTRTPVFLRLFPEGLYDPNRDAVTELQGWEGVRAEIREAAETLGPGTPVVSCQYALCAQILQQLEDRPKVYCASERRTEFDFIGRRDPPAGARVLYVNDDHYPEPPAERLPARGCELIRTVPVERGGRVVRHYRLYACSPEGPGHVPPGSLSLDAH